MNISELSIRRPVLATVMTVIILLFGIIGYTYLGVREYPSVDNPIITVSCSYAGANADVIEEMKTICQCLDGATRNVRFINGEAIFEGEQVAIDGEDKVTYESMCRSSHKKLVKTKNKNRLYQK